MTILVTGGAGFIGSNFVLDWLAGSDEPVVNLDKLTYAGSLANLGDVADDGRHHFVRGGIEDRQLVGALLARHRVRAIVHLAAESHVDRSIAGPDAFVATNIAGTFELLEAARIHWQSLAGPEREGFRFLHVSTDEVYGTLAPGEQPFTEASPYRPNSPYAASKAAADHLVRAHGVTYGLPVLITNCSNNYGPRHYPEKLVPLIIHSALEGKALPIYGDGQQRRDWLYVGDHCSALRRVLEKGRPGETYNIGGNAERANIDVVRQICLRLDALRPRSDRRSYTDQIAFIADRPGHDRRYAIDAGKLRGELGWQPRMSFEAGLDETLRWNLANARWRAEVTSGAYRTWMETQYA